LTIATIEKGKDVFADQIYGQIRISDAGRTLPKIWCICLWKIFLVLYVL